MRLSAPLCCGSFHGKMCIRYLGFVLLIWFPGALHAQSATQSCSAPTLDGGFFAPKHETYSHGTKLTYTCNNGRKPAVKGWWATSTCQNGKWSHEPQCIDVAACFPPEIPNAEYTANQNGWYEDRNTIRITCDDGYEHKDRAATTTCISGAWSPVLVCEKSINACGEPPKIPHAVIIHQRYQEVFPVDSEVQYECQDGFTVEGADSKIFCIAGNWTEGPPCKSSVGSELNDRETEPQITTSICGDPPVVQNGEVVATYQRFLKYQCVNFYKLVGPETVECFSDSTWSEVPTCKGTFCLVDTDTNENPVLKPVGVKFIKDGESLKLECKKRDDWVLDHHSVVQCIDGRMTFTPCCNRVERFTHTC